MSLLASHAVRRHGGSPGRRAPLIVASVALLLACAGCAPEEGTSTSSSPTSTEGGSPGTPPAPGVSAAALEFWQPATTRVVEEVSPARSLEELADRATLVVRGPVTQAGGRGGNGWPAALTVEPREVLTGTADAPVRVDVHAAVGRTQAGERTDVPAEDYLWFLVPAEEAGVWHPVTVAGVVGPGSRGPVTTVLQPTDSVVVVPAGTGTLDEAVARAGLAGR